MLRRSALAATALIGIAASPVVAAPTDAPARAGVGPRAAPLYSTSAPDGAAIQQRSFLVGKAELSPGRYRATTRHIVRRRSAPDTLEEATATVDCRRPGIEAMGGRIDLDGRPTARDRDAHNLWWAVCRGQMQRFKS